MEPLPPPGRRASQPGASAPREVFLAAQLETATRSRISVTQELHSTGARLLSIGRFKPGEAVALWMLIPGTHAQVRVEGRVVQAAPFSVSGPWRCALTVQFDAPLDPEQEAQLLSEARGSGAH